MDRKMITDSQSEVPNPPVLQFPHYLQSVVSAINYRGEEGDCSSFEVLIQCNTIKSRVITGEALPLPLQLGPAIL
jgi:hypothetical protein